MKLFHILLLLALLFIRSSKTEQIVQRLTQSRKLLGEARRTEMINKLDNHTPTKGTFLKYKGKVECYRKESASLAALEIQYEKNMAEIKGKEQDLKVDILGTRLDLLESVAQGHGSQDYIAGLKSELLGIRRSIKSKDGTDVETDIDYIEKATSELDCILILYNLMDRR